MFSLDIVYNLRSMNFGNWLKYDVYLKIVMAHFPESYLKGDEICSTFTALKYVR